ncbi:hypothetical protein AB835_04010 [Candidatus Endobugula sertula]|uniref:Cadherin domain-containing protein n=1 Tax=Candidatus Endobugula sertula TaxID=62101 RepID=A0A1D2QRY4_9GAMM|nr:hypothetical protein AB835_04010 [Candidatus Endobugula sertula]
MFVKRMSILRGKLSSFLPTVIFLLLVPVYSFAQETVCAEVKIEIAQELTIERQAFEATLKIENTLADKTIENIHVVVEFKDELGETVIATNNPDDTTAKFFIRINHLDGINDISGNGTLAGGQTANATWLIIPAPGASDGVSSGKLYFVGATFNYRLDGVEGAIEVAPDTIYVKPMPLLTLDYFLPFDVFADNPLTTDVIEPIEPFTLGIRIQNNGNGLGRSIKIESAQPEIVENEQELLIDFTLLNSYVQDEPINNSLLMMFGDIPAGESKMGRWNMQTTLSGRFKEFTAEYSHADELGGELTSLIEAANTHTLIRDVVVDAPGRDNVKDFLAYELSSGAGDIYIYESNSTTSPVTNQSGSATLSNNATTLHFSSTSGFVYAQVTDPYSGAKEIDRVIRNDGKQISTDNVWFSKSYNKASKELSYHLNIFDVNSSGQYALSYTDPEIIPNPPVLQFIPLKTTYEGNTIAFLVEATDADGTTPTIAASGLPEGANFVDQNDGTGVLSWTPSVGQEGNYEFQIEASDGELNAYQTVTIVVNSELDIDGDGLLDSWELEHFGDLSRDGSGDFDGDGVLDRDEEKNGTDPLAINLAVMESPVEGATLADSSVQFSWTDVKADRYELDIGTTQGAHNILHDLQVMDTETVIDNLPADGQALYLRLWTVFGNVKGFNDYIYNAVPEKLISSVHFPDENLRLCIAEYAQERNWLYVHQVTNVDCELKQINDATGIEQLTQLRRLNLLNNNISTINVSTLRELRVLNLGYNQLTEIDVSGLVNLTVLHLWSNTLTTLDVSDLTQLKVLHVDTNQLDELNVSTLLDLRSLHVGNNRLSALTVSSLDKLQFLWAYNNQLSKMDVSNLLALRRLNVSNNALAVLDVSKLLNLTELKAANNEIAVIATENLSSLQSLDMSNNLLSEITLSNSDKITRLEVSNNSLSDIQVAHMSGLESFNIHNNQLTSLNLLGLNALVTVNAYSNQLTSLQVTGLQKLIKLHVDKNRLSTLNLSGLSALESLHITHNLLTEVNVTESVNLNRLWAYNNFLVALNVSGLENIVILDASNNELTSLDISSSLTLKDLRLDDNNLETLDVAALTHLEYLNVNYNNLEELKVDNLINLTHLHATYNQITDINVSNLVGLTEFTIWSNRLRVLDASSLVLLTRLHVDNNELVSLNIANLVNLTSLNIAGNSLDVLDISHLSNLEHYWE